MLPSTSSEAHSRVCQLAGGDDSSKGLHQLLWLTQAEFRLPDAKKFDSSVQAQLRGLLGVLQTRLDDAFIGRVSFVAQQPQFTPPVIYSLDQRDKLVFLVEARFDQPTTIRPGVPVDVRLAP